MSLPSGPVQPGEEMEQPRRVPPNAFHMPTVSFDVRRLFRGRTFGDSRGRGAERGNLMAGHPSVYRPVFRGLGSWCNRRGDFRVNRPGFGNTYVENISAGPSGLFDDDGRHDESQN
ncbi:hypothetical protein RvY_00761 [Ramazzottius varieornatus]|uniref:Uncharacterized protein n=1 Tax=Ramazzottius varieornatus TaxID=947166 RepID=A0A1D1UDW8_RAMVA|nr:hypothetical protein RvY_00761 [Ramazzottius varieornatus]